MTLPILTGSSGLLVTATGATAVPSPLLTTAFGAAPPCASSVLRTICNRLSLPSRLRMTRAKKSLRATSPIDRESGFRRTSILLTNRDFHFRKSAELILFYSLEVASRNLPREASSQFGDVDATRSCLPQLEITTQRHLPTRDIDVQPAR